MELVVNKKIKRMVGDNNNRVFDCSDVLINL